MATSSAQRIVIVGLITPIARSIGIEPNPNDRVPSSERLKLIIFEQMKFCNVEAGCGCWIYLENQLMPLPNIDCITLLSLANLYFLASDKELAQPMPLPSPTHLRVSSSSKPSSSFDLTGLHATLQ